MSFSPRPPHMIPHMHSPSMPQHQQQRSTPPIVKAPAMVPATVPSSSDPPTTTTTTTDISSRQHRAGSTASTLARRDRDRDRDEKKVRYTTLIRLPFARGTLFQEPGPIHWDAEKDARLWAIVSTSNDARTTATRVSSSLGRNSSATGQDGETKARGAGGGNDNGDEEEEEGGIDWGKLAVEFEVSVPFMIQQAAWLYERHLASVRMQMKKGRMAPTATASGTAAGGGGGGGGVAMKRGGSANSRGNATARAMQQTTAGGKESPIARGEGSAPGTPREGAPPLSRSPSAATVTQSRAQAVATSSTGSPRLAQAQLYNPTRQATIPEARDPATVKPNTTTAAASASSSRSENAEERGPPPPRHAFKRPPTFRAARPGSKRALGASTSARSKRVVLANNDPSSSSSSSGDDDDDEDNDDDDESSSPSFPFAIPTADPGATLRSGLPISTSRATTATSSAFASSEAQSAERDRVHRRRDTLRAAVAPPVDSSVESASVSSASASASTRSIAVAAAAAEEGARIVGSPPLTTTTARAVGLSPLAGAIGSRGLRASGGGNGGGGAMRGAVGSPRRTGMAQAGSEGGTSMGSSFSDLDDPSVTQSALEEALFNNYQQQGPGSGTGPTAGMASRMSSLSHALRSKYLPNQN